MKQCPNCGSHAQDGWILCPSCGMDMKKAAKIIGRDYYIYPEAEPVLTNQVPSPQQGKTTQSRTAEVPSRPIPDVTYSSNGLLIILLIVTLPAVFTWLPLGWICVIASAIVVYIDVKGFHGGNNQKEHTFNSSTWSPLSWALMVLLFWVIGMPFYLYRRRQIWERSVASPVT